MNTFAETATRAFGEGIADFERGKSLNANPYPTGDTAFAFWREGWTAERIRQRPASPSETTHLPYPATPTRPRHRLRAWIGRWRAFFAALFAGRSAP